MNRKLRRMPMCKACRLHEEDPQLETQGTLPFYVCSTVPPGMAYSMNVEKVEARRYLAWLHGFRKWGVFR